MKRITTWILSIFLGAAAVAAFAQGSPALSGVPNDDSEKIENVLTKQGDLQFVVTLTACPKLRASAADCRRVPGIVTPEYVLTGNEDRLDSVHSRPFSFSRSAHVPLSIVRDRATGAQATLRAIIISTPAGEYRHRFVTMGGFDQITKYVNATYYKDRPASKQEMQDIEVVQDVYSGDSALRVMQSLVTAAQAGDANLFLNQFSEAFAKSLTGSPADNHAVKLEMDKIALQYPNSSQLHFHAENQLNHSVGDIVNHRVTALSGQESHVFSIQCRSDGYNPVHDDMDLTTGEEGCEITAIDSAN